MNVAATSIQAAPAPSRAIFDGPAVTPEAANPQPPATDSIHLGGARDLVRVAYTPQDPSTMPAIETTVPRENIGTAMSSPRVLMEDGSPAAAPDADGNYLFAPGTPAFQQANAFACTDKTLRLFEDCLGHTVPWAFSGPLKIHPHYQEGFNAFYLRLNHSVNFFSGFDPKRGVTVHGSESLDVVSHEVGHALLDGMKPGLVGWFGSIEAKSFHESFADVAAILTALQDDRVIDRLVAETGGNLHRPNVVAGMAEEFSQGINNAMLGGTRPADWTLRNANNTHLYQDPETLPKKPTEPDGLAKEPHSFSQVFTGACWDVLSGMVAENMSQGMGAREAIVAARDTFGPLYAHAVELGPDRMKTYTQMADAMLSADRRYFGSQHEVVIGRAFSGRRIPHDGQALTPESLPALSLPAGAGTTLADTDAFLSRSRQALGVPDTTPLAAQKCWKNGQGETFIHYAWVEEMPLDDRTYTELGGSLTLGFDAQGKLFHRLWEPVDDEQRRMARAEIEDVVSRQAVRASMPRVSADFVRPDGKPYEAWVDRDGARQKLVKVPMAS